MTSTPTRRRPDASMTLLIEVMQRPLDPGYAAARARRDAGEPPATGRVRVLTAAACVLAGALLVAAVLPLRQPAEVSPQQLLTQEISERTGRAEATVSEIEALRAEIADVQARALDDGDGQIDLLDRLQVSAGSVPLRGPAALVTLDNASTAGDPVAGDPRDAEAASDGRVIDVDLQIVVNGLWAAGAEAIAVDGVRLTSLSAIRNAGEAVLVDQQPLQPPYEIVALGPAQELQTRFADSAAGAYLSGLQQNYGVRASVTGADDVRLPASGSLRLRYARTPPAGQVGGQVGEDVGQVDGRDGRQDPAREGGGS